MPKTKKIIPKFRPEDDQEEQIFNKKDHDWKRERRRRKQRRDIKRFQEDEE